MSAADEAVARCGAPAAWWGAEAVTVRYGSVTALAEVTFRARPGQVSAVVGGDGAGRTTLLRCLAGTLAPSAGGVRRPSRRDVGYLPAGSGVYPDLTVAENLAFRAAAYQVPAGVAAARIAGYLDRAGLAGATGRLGRQLSGGMRQKLGVIAALLPQPALLVLDEPTTGVDPVSRADLWSLITRAAADGAAVVVATSYLDEAERAAQVLVLDGGQALAVGAPEDIVAAMPGVVRAGQARPGGPGGERAWRRAGRWQAWYPDGAAGSGPGSGDPVQPDLQDAVTVAILARKPAGASAGPVAAGASAGPVAGGWGAAGAGTVTGPLAECRAVSQRFGALTAVDRVDLTLGRGEVVGLIGANGAGKTTLIRMLLGLLPATAGEVGLFGGPPTRAARRRVGYLPQGLGLYDDLTAAENLAFAAAVFRTGGQAALPGDLRRYARTRAGELPLGVQRRVAFAGALAHRPDLLILDEPTSGVDPLARARLWETIAAAAAGGAGVLVTTHYLDEAGECDRLVIMSGGRVVDAGTARDITGDAPVCVVRAPGWTGAFSALEAAGLRVSLAGRALRVPGASPAEVRRVLGEIPAQIATQPATLEERFFELTAGAGEPEGRS